MEISSLFKKSLSYPLSDYKKLIMLGVVFLISQIGTIILGFDKGLGGSLSGVLGIISFVFSLIVAGYMVSVIKETIEGSDEIPDFKLDENIVNGIKYIVMELIYLIPTVIIILIVGAVTGLYGTVLKIIDQLDPNIFNAGFNQTAFQTAINEIPNSTMTALGISLTITFIVAVIVLVLYGFFTLVGACRLAQTGSLKEALKARAVWKDISAIGWGSFIVWYIVLLILLIILGIISSVIGWIPYVGAIIVALLVSPFIALFTARSIGLMYTEK